MAEPISPKEQEEHCLAAISARTERHEAEGRVFKGLGADEASGIGETKGRARKEHILPKRVADAELTRWLNERCCRRLQWRRREQELTQLSLLRNLAFNGT